MDIRDYQRRTASTDRSQGHPWVGLAQSTFGLIEKLGSITACVKKQIRDGPAYKAFMSDVRSSIGDTLWYLSSVSSHLGIDLDEVAAENIAATEARWVRPENGHPGLFSTMLDDEYPENEQLPRRFRARFSQRSLPEISWLPMVEVWVEDRQMGDPIDDNVATADNYRLHDILHLANAAFLGWSPVVRKLLNRKRKSNPHVDKYQDGARARDTEEALARLIHEEAKRNSFFQGVDTIDTPFLQKVQAMVADLEVRVRTLAEWQRCILGAYRVFRLLVENNGGIVVASLEDHTLDYEGPA